MAYWLGRVIERVAESLPTTPWEQLRIDQEEAYLKIRQDITDAYKEASENRLKAVRKITGRP